MVTVINFIKLLFLDLFLAIKYAALEYDDRLRQTKTNTQRFLIWVVIITVSLVFIYLMLLLIGKGVLSITQNYDKIIPQ